jgi:hypothetical protein
MKNTKKIATGTKPVVKAVTEPKEPKSVRLKALKQSGVKYISWKENIQTWKIDCFHEGKIIYVGTHPDLDEAIRIQNKAKKNPEGIQELRNTLVNAKKKEAAKLKKEVKASKSKSSAIDL